MEGMNRKGWLAAALTLWLCAGTLCAQNKDESRNPYKGKPFKERMVFGGDLGLSFGDVTYVRVAPLIGYLVSDRFTVGGGPSYQYWRIRSVNQFGPQSRETTIWGMNTFARFFLLESLFVQSDFEILNLKSSFRDQGSFFEEEVFRVNVPVWLVGAGYMQRSGRGGFMIGAFYDLIQDRNSPYGRDLILRAGVFF